jgi:hypothetical protein
MNVNVFSSTARDEDILDFCLQSEFWPGFVLALEKADAQTRWKHLQKILEQGSIL